MTGLIKNSFRLLLLVCIASCASRLTPEGGKKDVTAPVLTEASPVNSTVNFSGNEIVLTFDEFVQLVDLQSQLVVSPLMEPRPQISAYKNKITIVLPDTLLPNTTYSFNFGKSIADVHESNLLDGYRYVFSTGNEIDSLSISGLVKESAGLKPGNKITVMLYRNSSAGDTTVLKRKPDYFTRTNEYGEYTLENLSAGTYSIVALDDKNGNYVYDDPSQEALAFADSVISIPPTAKQYLKLDYSHPLKLRVKQVNRIRKTAVQIVFNRPVDTLNVKMAEGRSYDQPLFFSETRDTAFIFAADTLQDSLNVVISGDHELQDTISVRMIMNKPVLDASTKGIVFSAVSTPATKGLQSDFQIKSLNPLKKADGIELKEDTLEIDSFKVQIDQADPRLLRISYPWKPGKRYTIRAEKESIRDVYGIGNDSTGWGFEIPDDRSAGEILITVAGDFQNGKYLLQLCNEDLKVLRQEVITDNHYTFSYVEPGKYILRVVNDQNGNGHWDHSDYAIKKQAEPVTVTEVLQVRASWTLEKEVFIPQVTK